MPSKKNAEVESLGVQNGFGGQGLAQTFRSWIQSVWNISLRGLSVRS